MDKKQYTYEEFINIVKTLRSDQGCPWDAEQTHQSLKPCMMEEAAEVVSAIRIYDKTGDYENLKEELGDVLLQVVMHATIAEEEGIFNLEDVIQEISAKMVRRHPHVFGSVAVSGSEQVLENWEEIKQKEKEGKSKVESPLREIPKELPALTRMTKVLKKVDKLYESQSEYLNTVKRIQLAASKLEEIIPASYDPQVTQQIGDLLCAVSDISRICKLSPEQILTDRIEDIIDCYEPRA